jgi:hypothetical protein
MCLSSCTPWVLKLRNVHLGTKGQAPKILNDLQKKKPAWLRDAAIRTARILEKDWNRYRKS